jgi:hypothetical protein
VAPNEGQRRPEQSATRRAGYRHSERSEESGLAAGFREIPQSLRSFGMTNQTALEIR